MLLASRRIYITMPEPFLRDVDKTAEIERRSRSELIREALRRYMLDQEARLRAKEEAFRVIEEIRRKNRGFSVEEIEQDVKQAVAEVRRARKGRVGRSAS